MDIMRPLGALERMFWFLNQGSSLNFVSIAHITGEISPQALRIALDTAQIRHPLLRVRIFNKSKFRPFFTSQNVPAVPLRIASIAYENYIEELEKELNTSIAIDTGPLIRCTLLQHGKQKATLMVTFHHCIGDGFSGVYLLRDLLTWTTAALKGEKIDVISLPERGSQEQIYPSWAQGIKGIFGMLKAQVLLFLDLCKKGIPQPLSNQVKAPYNQRRFGIVPYVLDCDTTSQLVMYAREHKTSVHAVLAAAFSIAIAKHLEKKKFTIGCLTPGDLRPHLQPPIEEDIGLYVSPSGLVPLCKIDKNTSLASLAYGIKQDLKAQVANGMTLHLLKVTTHMQIAPMCYLFGVGKSGLKRISAIMQGLTRAFTLTNLGVLKLSIPSSLKLESLNFAVALSALGNWAATVTTLDGKMCINFTYTQPLISKDRAEKLAQETIEILKKIK